MNRLWMLAALAPLAAAAAAGARIESGVVLLPGETLVAPPGPVAAPQGEPRRAPRTPQYSNEEVRRDSHARSARGICVNCAVITGIDRNPDARWEVRLRFEDGTRETIRSEERPRVNVGDAVHVEDGRVFRD